MKPEARRTDKALMAAALPSTIGLSPRVTLSDRFWAPRIRTNREVTIPAEYEQCRQAEEKCYR